MKKIAIIGTGISGMVVARELHANHDITVYEAGDYIGGHTNTIDVDLDGRTYAVDTGFIVFNDWTYPNFIRLLDELGVESQPSTMSFSVCCQRTGLEYNGSSLNALFAQRQNLIRPSFYHMIRDILRFNAEAPALLNTPDDEITLGRYLLLNGYSQQFMEHYIIPMGAAIWSTDPESMYRFPAHYFIRFFHNHGILSINRRPQWRTVHGGSRAYVDKLVAPFRQRIRLNTPVHALHRHDDHVEVHAAGRPPERYDYVFNAAHSNQALNMLSDSTRSEREVLGAIPYQHNRAVLHTDSRLLPTRRRAWGAWNYHIPNDSGHAVALTYNMNILQSLQAGRQFCVTLNRTAAIDPKHVIRAIDYEHPLFTPAGVAAQRRHREINGMRRTYYCGAYWGFGFHEDGVNSALAACGHFLEDLEHEQRNLRRTA